MRRAEEKRQQRGDDVVSASPAKLRVLDSRRRFALNQYQSFAG
jgi:hypothetical protein